MLKTFMFVIKRIILEVVILNYVIWQGIKNNADIDLIIYLCILCSIILLIGIIACELTKFKDNSKNDNQDYKCYRQWKEPYRWISGVDY